ncbi:sensor histidine kinase [Paenibacillus chartarius]|uniref:histidine kinase n=1 Tax=Paenibacillus chartarius TaxID=747481 RepID=A0ABV6DJF3_9BACL
MELLERSRQLLRDEHAAAEREDAFRNLVIGYEKLLKTAVKISRISDIQGRTLKEREQKLREAGESLKMMEAQRKKLVSDISHELGTPMTSIQGYVKAMLDGVVPADGEYLGMIYGKVQYVNQLVADLFQLSRLESNKIPFTFRLLTPEELLRPYTTKFKIDADKAGVELSFTSCSQAAEAPIGSRKLVKADPYRIEQVMTNFVHNAIKFTPSGGAIQIEAELGDAPGEQSGTSLIVRVTDTGIGLHEESLPYVFERFYRVKAADGEGVSGTGLGLAISREIILQHNGTIGVISKYGEGSTFYFTLPMVDMEQKGTMV